MSLYFTGLYSWGLAADGLQGTLYGVQITPYAILMRSWKNLPLTNGEASRLLLDNCNKPLRTESKEVFISALLYSFHHIFLDRSDPTIFTEGHGRESPNPEVDLSGTVGWFTTLTPIYAYAEDSDSLIDVIRKIKDVRRRIPGNGQPYFASRFFNDSAWAEFRKHEKMEIVVNFIGSTSHLRQPGSSFRMEDLEGDSLARFGQGVNRLAIFEITIEAKEDGLHVVVILFQ